MARTGAIPRVQKPSRSSSRTSRYREPEAGGQSAANPEVFQVERVKIGRRSGVTNDYKEFTFQRTPGRQTGATGYIRTVVFKGKINADIHNALLFVLRAVASDIQKDLQRTVANWNHKVNFYIRSRKEGKNTIVGRTFYDKIDSITYAEVVYGTKDPAWHYLESGTDTRWMGVTPDWVSKTSPNSFESGRGGGGVAGFYAENAAQGIEARNWFQMLHDKYRKRFEDQIAYNYKMAFKGSAK